MKKVICTKNILIASLIILVLLVSGCAKHVTIKELTSNPSDYLGKKIIVSGKVVMPMNIAQMSGFSLKDDGATIMVSSSLVPETDSKVTVEGTFVKGLFIQQEYIFADRIEKE